MSGCCDGLVFFPSRRFIFFDNFQFTMLEHLLGASQVSTYYSRSIILVMNRPCLIVRLTSFLSFILASTFFSPSSVRSQNSTSSITGAVINSATHDPVIGVSVSIVGTSLGVATDVEGKFTISRVPVGRCQVRVSGVGFQPMLKTDVIVNSAKPTALLFELMQTVIEFEGVTITTGYFPKDVDNPVSVQTLGAEDVRRLPGGYEDVVRAVSILPGVAQVQAGRNDLIVRGGAPSENLYVVDNIELENINHFGTQGASGGPLSYINLDFVDHTDFSSGGFGVQYGDKLSSVLNIALKDGRTDRLGGKATISASQFGLNLEGPLSSDNGSFIFSARRSYLDFLFKALGANFIPEYWDFTGKADYRLSPQDQLSFLGIGAIDYVSQANNTNSERYQNSQVLFSNQNQAVGGVTLKHTYENGFATLTYGSTYVGYDTKQNDSLLYPIFTTTSYEYDHSLKANGLLQLSKKTEVSGGVQGQIVRFKADLFLQALTTSLGSFVPAVSSTYDTTALKAALYGQVAHQFDKLRLTVGGRIDYFSLINDHFAFAPRFTGTYAVDGITNVNLSVGQYYQAPSYIWLVAVPAVNSHLTYIGVNQYIIGFDHLLRSDVKFSIEAYYKQYFDYAASITRPYLVMANTGAGYGGVEEGFASYGTDPLVSKGSGAARGIELFLQKKSSDVPLYGLFSVSYGISEFKALDGIERPSSFDQRWIINTGGGYIFNDQWEASIKFRYATGRPYTPYVFTPAGVVQYPSQYNTVRIAANHSADVRIDRRWGFSGWSLDTYIDIQDIYNKIPVDVPVYDPQEQKFESQGNLGIIPSIGVSAEF